MIEQRFGAATSTAVLAMMLVTLVVFCFSTVWNLGVKPVYETISSALQGNTIALPENFVAITISAVVLGVVPMIGAFVAARLFVANVQSQLALAAYQQRASLEIRYAPEPPYRVQNGKLYRLGIYNHGPSMAMEAQVRLLRVVPSNTLPDYSLPGNFLWPNVEPPRSSLRPQAVVEVQRASRNIAPGQELQLNAFQPIAVSAPEPGGPRYGATFFLTVAVSVTNMKDGEECHLEIQATALNADPVLGRFVLRREGDRMTFQMVDASGEVVQQ